MGGGLDFLPLALLWFSHREADVINPAVTARLPPQNSNLELGTSEVWRKKKNQNSKKRLCCHSVRWREQGTAAQAGPVTALGLLQGERRSWCPSEVSHRVGDRARQHGAGTTEMRRSGRSLTSWMNP